MVLAETFHHSSAPLSPKFKEELVERHEQHEAPRGQETARTRVATHCTSKTGVAGVLSSSSCTRMSSRWSGRHLSLRCAHRGSWSGTRASAMSSSQLLRALAVPPERVPERIVGTAPGAVRRRKRKRRRRKKLSKTSSSRSSSLTHLLATGLGKKLTGVRNNGDLWWVRPDDKMQVMLEYVSIAVRMKGDLRWLPPDGKTQVTIEHAQRADETDADENGDLWWVRPVGMKVIRKILGEIILRNGQRTLSLCGDRTHLYFHFSCSSLLVVLREMMMA